MYRKIDVRTMCVQFNEVREKNLSVDLTREELLERMRAIGISDRLVRSLVSNAVIQRAPKRRFRFLSTPLHWSTLERCVNECRDKRTMRVVSEELTLERAIALLKSEGYKILRPRTEYDEL